MIWKKSKSTKELGPRKDRNSTRPNGRMRENPNRTVKNPDRKVTKTDRTKNIDKPNDLCEEKLNEVVEDMSNGQQCKTNRSKVKPNGHALSATVKRHLSTAATAKRRFGALSAADVGLDPFYTNNMRIHGNTTISHMRSGCSFVHLDSLPTGRLAAQEMQRLNDAPHVLSRGGYAKLEKMRKTRAEALGLKSLDLAPAPARYELWKAAHTKSDGRMTSSSAALISQQIDELVKQQTQGTFVGQGRDDILTTAIGLPDYFGPAQKNTQSISQEALRKMDLQWEERLNQSMRSMEQRFMEQLQEQKEIQRALEEKFHSMTQPTWGCPLKLPHHLGSALGDHALL
ncbi:hypothetical protein LR48_Vigan464s003300 [Vigna angularis]|uniref:Uncharacterized protein n=1 Tax=Phaseolus angularis TaxID=3914 RepID=A0A0L9TBQ3_PHAAN|nr:hypothetical protein LR48_Vigan464s003300 [Vigna angularis]